MRVTRLRNSVGSGKRTATLGSSGAIVAGSRASSAPSSALARTVSACGPDAGSDRTTTETSLPAISLADPLAASRRGMSPSAAAR